jgi:hypothetical protein
MSIKHQTSIYTFITNQTELTMNKYYKDGMQIDPQHAVDTFLAHWSGAVCLPEAREMWGQCQVSEEARDEWLPSELEIVTNG